MSIRSAYAGEDIPVRISYEDSNGDPVDPDDQATDGTPDADITIVDLSDETEVVSSVAMTNVSTGEFEYVWDSDVDGAGPGEYRVEVTAEFSSQTKISKNTINLR